VTTLIIIQLVLAILLVALVLLQGSDNEGLGLGGGTGGGIGGMMSARGSANLLSRLTAITATLFMIMSVVLTIAASVGSDKNVLESLPSISSEEDNNTADSPEIPENN
jgi:preprotein translocase subunit SecG